MTSSSRPSLWHELSYDSYPLMLLTRNHPSPSSPFREGPVSRGVVPPVTSPSSVCFPSSSARPCLDSASLSSLLSHYICQHPKPLSSITKSPHRRKPKRSTTTSHVSCAEELASPFPFLPLFSPKSPPASLARPFEDALSARLLSLLPLPDSSPSLPLSWLARAVRLLALTLSDAAALLPDATSSSDRDAVAAYLDSGVALLDACNAASAEVDRLLRRRLHLRFALHLLSSSDEGRNPEKLSRARGSLAEWRSSSPRPTGDLARSLAPAQPPRGKLSAIRRAIYAVEAVSFLLSGVLASALGGGDVAALVPADLPWANEYRKVAAAVSHKLAGARSPAESKAVESAVKKMTDVMDGIQSNGDGDDAERLRKAVEATEKATGELTESLDALSGAVNELFRSALALRNTALHGFRAGPAGCK